jgi:hypothetical protein
LEGVKREREREIWGAKLLLLFSSPSVIAHPFTKREEREMGSSEAREGCFCC